MKTIAMTLTLALTLLFTTPASAGVPSPAVDARQADQAQRIQRGVVSGELTGREARALIHQQREIARLERRFEADGVLGRHERQVLRGLQAQASRRIAVQKHDRQDRH